MTLSPERASTATAIVSLSYTQAPLVGLYFLAALAFGFCILQKPKSLPTKKRRIAFTLALAILLSYVCEVLYYFSRSMADENYEAPQSSAINCLGSILVWCPLGVSLIKSQTSRWPAYFGTSVVQFAIETTLCLLYGLALPSENRYNSIPLVLRCFRSLASSLFSVTGFSILIERQNKTEERGSDEEGQALLAGRQNGAATTPEPPAYGSISQETSQDEDDEARDDDKELKEQQAKRLEEEGGWIGYLKGFSILFPHLWPKDDWVIMMCLVLRGINLIQGRVFNLLTPRQLGIITNKLSSGTRVMPWKDVALWTFYSWINSYAGFGVIDNFASVVISNNAYKRITLMAYKHVMNLSTDFHTNKDSGEVLKAVEQASSLNTLIELVLFDLVPIFVDLVIAMWYVTHLFDPYMAFIISFMGAVYIWLGLYFTTWAQSRRRVYMEKQRGESQVVNETIHNWQSVFYFNRAPYEHNRYENSIVTTIRAHYHYYFRSVGGHALQSMVMTLGFAGCCVFAISQIISGRRPVGNLVTFIMYWETMMSPLYMMAYSYRHISSCLIDAERMLQLLRTDPTVNDKDGARDIEIKEGKVVFQDVDFAYDDRKQVIKGVNITAEPGQTIAFVGETGGGKSTMSKLLHRAWDVTGGSISIDGQDSRSVTRASLREAMGVVPQDPELFNISIRENIRYGRLGATDDEIVDACRAAAIHDSIVEFPDDYKSKVGERGVKLSGGQSQRIAIARVLLKNPKIVLLDEATSAVDSAIEAQIQDAFKKLSKGRTTFVIAHRLSTIVEADQIAVIDKGEIIERGTHSQLLALGGKYFELWTKQTAGNLSSESSQANSTCGDDKNEVLIDVTPEDDSTKTTGRSDGHQEDDVQKRR